MGGQMNDTITMRDLFSWVPLALGLLGIAIAVSGFAVGIEAVSRSSTSIVVTGLAFEIVNRALSFKVRGPEGPIVFAMMFNWLAVPLLIATSAVSGAAPSSCFALWVVASSLFLCYRWQVYRWCRQQAA